MSGQITEIPTDLWNEDGDRVWIRYDLCANAGKARYKALKGDGLPIGMGDDNCLGLTDLRVRVIWASYAPEGEWDEWPWRYCVPTAEGSVKFWEVREPAS